MSASRTTQGYLARHPWIPALGYVAAVAALVAVTGLALADIYQRHVALAAATDMLDRVEGRRPALGGAMSAGGPVGSPFLEGQTVTVAGAALLQRVAAAVTKVGGNVLSSQVELQGSEAKDGFVSLIVSCELDQPALQQMLYDVEAGMPFLFVDQLVVQAPQAAASADGGRMRVLLGVSGKWQETK
ncbi:MAG: type II secretion system protein GspM [Xanthobacteraceae bacterium]|jgi:general secretion pathway protein M